MVLSNISHYVKLNYVKHALRREDHSKMDYVNFVKITYINVLI